MPLHLHRAERADALADGLGRLLGEIPADPFATEVVAVPAKGVGADHRRHPGGPRRPDALRRPRRR
ncbi:hypothetical protein ACFWF3_29020, partial [Nocardia sp. NPDC060220]|uniref:hypothetical protein n=1 Tax=Nocardia sp. NPDC060220 TaxID=3347076 RepID=UPI003664F017